MKVYKSFTIQPRLKIHRFFPFSYRICDDSYQHYNKGCEIPSVKWESLHKTRFCKVPLFMKVLPLNLSNHSTCDWVWYIIQPVIEYDTSFNLWLSVIIGCRVTRCRPRGMFNGWGVVPHVAGGGRSFDNFFNFTKTYQPYKLHQPLKPPKPNNVDFHPCLIQ